MGELKVQWTQGQHQAGVDPTHKLSVPVSSIPTTHGT